MRKHEREAKGHIFPFLSLPAAVALCLTFLAPSAFCQGVKLKIDSVTVPPPLPATGVPVNITLREPIEKVASTDLILSYDTTCLTATSVTVPNLSVSAQKIDDAAGQVKVLTTDPGGKPLNAGDILMTVLFTVFECAQPGTCSSLALTDEDGDSDFEGPIPPIPPVPIPWKTNKGEICPGAK